MMRTTCIYVDVYLHSKDAAQGWSNRTVAEHACSEMYIYCVNEMRPMIRTSNTMFYSLLYLNSPPLGGLGISVGGKYHAYPLAIYPFVDVQSAFTPSLGGS